MPASEHVGQFIEGQASEEQLRPTRPAVTEAERDANIDRDTVRRIILAQAQTIVDAALDTPPDQEVPVHSLIIKLRETVVPAIREFRDRNRQRYLLRLEANVSKLG